MNEMNKDVRWFMRREVLLKTPYISRLTSRFLEKARNNLTTMSILFDLYDNNKARGSLNVPEDYDASEWVVVCSYYAMYVAALAALARVGYRSKNHTATVVALETFFVKKRLLEQRFLDMLRNAQLEKEQVDHLRLAKERREIAQYSVTKETTRKIAEKIKEDAYQFVDRIERLLE